MCSDTLPNPPNDITVAIEHTKKQNIYREENKQFCLHDVQTVS